MKRLVTTLSAAALAATLAAPASADPTTLFEQSDFAAEAGLTAEQVAAIPGVAPDGQVWATTDRDQFVTHTMNTLGVGRAEAIAIADDPVGRTQVPGKVTITSVADTDVSSTKSQELHQQLQYAWRGENRCRQVTVNSQLPPYSMLMWMKNCLYWEYNGSSVRRAQSSVTHGEAWHTTWNWVGVRSDGSGYRVWNGHDTGQYRSRRTGEWKFGIGSVAATTSYTAIVYGRYNGSSSTWAG